MSERVVESKAERVTLFEDRAEVVRRARVELVAGVARVSVAGVSALVDDTSVIARVPVEAGRILATRVVRQVRQEAAADASELRSLEAEWEARRDAREAAERAYARSDADLARARSLVEEWLASVRRVPRAGQAGPAAWRAAWQSLAQAIAAALDAIAAGRRALDDARRDEQHAATRLFRARSVHPRYETVVALQLDVAHAGPVEIELVYRVPCALWRPEHLARLVTSDGKQAIELTTFATAWQRTGEEWQGVQARFSTARPAQAAQPPRLAEDALTLRKKSDEERKEVVVEVREQAIAVAGLDRGARTVAEMPGVEDGGEPQWFEATRPVTLPSDGQPQRVEVATVTLPCTVERVAWPEIAQAPHLRATATLAGKTPLLAGPVRLARGGELVGRGRVQFVGQGEPFELGFGPDDGVRVRRTTDDARDTAAITGTQRILRTVELYLSNLSGDEKQLVVRERVLVSEIKDVTVEVVARGGFTLDERDGFLDQPVTLAPGETRRLKLQYRVEAGSKVRLPF